MYIPCSEYEGTPSASRPVGNYRRSASAQERNGFCLAPSECLLYRLSHSRCRRPFFRLVRNARGILYLRLAHPRRHLLCDPSSRKKRARLRASCPKKYVEFSVRRMRAPISGRDDGGCRHPDGDRLLSGQHRNIKHRHQRSFCRRKTDIRARAVCPRPPDAPPRRSCSLSAPA